MTIDCIGCLHGYFPKLDGGDLLIVTGDLTARDEPEQHEEFCDWMDVQPYSKKIVISGNHDNNLDPDGINCLRNCVYLCDSGTEFEGLKIWGTPHSLIFDRVNPHCTAFMGTEEELVEKYDLIPGDTDILISHTPPYGIFDKNDDGYCCGSQELLKAMFRAKPKYLICSHIHEWGGKKIDLISTKVINCSIMNEKYKPVNKAMRIAI